MDPVLLAILIAAIGGGFVAQWIARSGSHALRQELTGVVKDQAAALERRIDAVSSQMTTWTGANDQKLDRFRASLEQAQQHRGEEQQKLLFAMQEQQTKQLDAFAGLLTRLTESNEKRLDKLREEVGAKLQAIQDDNTKQLEEMRKTVDEKLHATLETRLGESFKIVSERLELVHKGLGEMQSLASGVGDLKKVLTNVKTRGVFGEYQLGAILEHMLGPDQYVSNVATRKGSNDRVEFAVKLPGQSGEADREVLLPIDSKFPQEAYLRLLDAVDRTDPEAVARAGKELEDTIKAEAKKISGKYLEPPQTTDFAILFLPSEGLYAEVLRRPGLAEALQRESRIVVTGPTTLAAVLNSLQMGFRTLAIQKRSSEVWELLAAVKTQMGTFGDLLAKTRKKLEETANVIDDAMTKSRAVERKLKNVQALPAARADGLLEAANLLDE